MSHRLDNGSNLSLSSTGPYTYSFYHAGSPFNKVFLETTVPMDIYITAGSDTDPNQFKYDMSFKSVVGRIAFSSYDMPLLMGSYGWAMAIDVQGIDESQN